MATFKFRIDNYPNNGGFHVMRDKWDGCFHLDAAIDSGPHPTFEEADKERDVSLVRKQWNNPGDWTVRDSKHDHA